MEDLKAQLEEEHVEYLRNFKRINPTLEATTAPDNITVEDIRRALDFEVRWGKYKGFSYREVFIKDPVYFKRTVVGGLNRVNSASFTARCFTLLCPLSSFPESKRKRKAVQPLTPLADNPFTLDDEIPSEPPGLIRC